jgi:two-component system cell cycle response regulator DivK
MKCATNAWLSGAQRTLIRITRPALGFAYGDFLRTIEMAKSVLIVEDNEHLRNIYASILRFSGYEIVEAESGTEAIEKAASAQPRLILLDLNLPDMPGIDVARSIKRHQRSAHIPIIGCSAFSIGEERENSLAAGMVDYLQKPFPSQVLKAKIEEFILP